MSLIEALFLHSSRGFERVDTSGLVCVVEITWQVKTEGLFAYLHLF